MGLQIAELFQSIQGEGKLIGTPSIFIRLMKCPLSCTFCFAGKADVNVGINKYKKIKDIEVGDKVLSYNFDREIVEERKVTKTFVSDTLEIMRVQMNKWTIVYCTPEHPFYIVGKGWVEAKKLKPNDEILCLEHLTKRKRNKYIICVDIINRETIYNSYKQLAGDGYHRLKVYNIEVENNNNFFVDGALVHNCDSKYTWNKSENPILELNSEDDIDNFVNTTELLQGKIKEVVITGGEPLIESNKPLIYYLIDKLSNKDFFVTVETTMLSNPLKDFKESHITKRIDELYENIYNISNKRPNLLLAISPKTTIHSYRNYSMSNLCIANVLKYYSISEEQTKDMKFFNFYFKFVYHPAVKKNVLSFISRLTSEVAKDEIYCMPLTSLVWNYETYNKTCLDTVNFCIENNLIYSPRLQIDLWQLQRGV